MKNDKIDLNIDLKMGKKVFYRIYNGFNKKIY